MTAAELAEELRTMSRCSVINLEPRQAAEWADVVEALCRFDIKPGLAPLHELWSLAVGTPGYDKAKWKLLESMFLMSRSSEREACAQVVERQVTSNDPNHLWDRHMRMLAREIRARGGT